MELIKVTEAKYIDGYKIEFKFNDNKKKIIDLKNELWGEVFEPLNNIDYFKKFKLNPFTIEWDNGADFHQNSFITLKWSKPNNDSWFISDHILGRFQIASIV